MLKAFKFACAACCFGLAFWRHGIAAEAISAFLLLEQTRPLYASVAKHDAASIRVLRKCGFACSNLNEGKPMTLTKPMSP